MPLQFVLFPTAPTDLRALIISRSPNKSTMALLSSSQSAAARSTSWRTRLLLFTALLFAPLAALAQSSPPGTIEGRVANAANGNYLNNPRVPLDGTSRETLTNRFGQFRFTDVPAGEAQLKVFYP